MFFLILQALYPRDTDNNMQKYGHSQVDINSKTPHFHDEFKIRLPAVITPQHHLLFTFFHVDLQMKLEAPKPVSQMFLTFHPPYEVFVSICQAFVPVI